MRNEIDKAFEITRKENRPALISFTVAGDNTKKKSLEILKSISSTVDIAEWGMAFNCPGADGPEIQNSSYRAIKNGITLDNTFSLIQKYKKIKNSKWHLSSCGSHSISVYLRIQKIIIGFSQDIMMISLLKYRII